MKVFSVTLAFFLTSYSTLTCQVPDSVQYSSLLPYDFNIEFLKAEKSILVDVREFFEYRRSRIIDAVNIPSSDNLEISTDTIDKDISLFFYCTTDYRSKRVAQFFIEKGFSKVYNLEGGISAWKDESMHVEKNRIRSR